MTVLPAQAEKVPLKITDIMKFRSIVSPQLSDNGKWLAYSAQPDRGNSTYHVQSIDGDITYQVNFGTSGTFSEDGKYIAIMVDVDLLTKEQTAKKDKKKLKKSLEIIELASGKRVTYKNIESFALSDNSSFLAFLTANKEDKSKDKKSDDTATKSVDNKENATTKTAQVITKSSDQEVTAKAAEKADEDSAKLFNKKRIKNTLTLVNLNTFDKQQINNVDSFAFSPKKPVLVYSLSTEDGKANALKSINLTNAKTTSIITKENASFNNFSWDSKGERVAFTQGDFSEKIAKRAHQLNVWQAKSNKLIKVKSDDAKWFISDYNELTWSKDDERLFFGFKLVDTTTPRIDTKPESRSDLYNKDKLTAGRSLQIWHGDDALIKTNEKYQLNKDKKHLYTAVYHVDDKDLVRLANEEVIYVKATNNEHAVIAKTDLKYRKLRTWEGFFSDYYIIDLESGKQSLIAQKLSSYTNVELSESGRYATYYSEGHYWLFDRKKNKTTNLTKGLATSFADEDHDYPSKVPGYGIAGWLEDDEGVLVYDKFDIWLLTLNAKDSKCLTCEQGRPNSLQFRVNQLDKERDYFKLEEQLLLTSYNDDHKNYGFYQLSLKDKTLTKSREEKKKFKFISKAKNADKILFSREDFNEFPDLWVSDLNPANGKKLTDVNPQKEHFLWGEPELVEWNSTMGEKHQGILIKPANYVEGMQYPVVVYYYRLFSQRMYEFNAMKVNHRPNFPYYTSNGYAIFLPDVHFEVGTPGHSTNKSILPGIQKIIDMGVADKNAIGLHGHSWSGYQTLHSITQTDMFAAAVSGAPVSNMTSAYSGIRLGTGLARQFQYEQGQSRIGASLFERRDLYIENSPVFFADRINTPLLMQFGDIDDAVPWQQGIEMYLAMRRLDKNVILLQYEGEPHHLKKYPNKVDYTIKMKQYFDHYLKGKPAPTWMVEGEAYQQKEKD
ncbi:prolyl oligopeptidase family serine peptidase [Thalassomonas sp. M1454]|uniref:S9 family peptidase n=1 Tax=Thalassomonas sp. M1454 TaxID=2594477 RepID=UPI00163D9596|nr:prolyl oligopeptidase family serine peptidase [Thalassomonas sp. M1454]